MSQKDPTKYRTDLFPLATKRADGKYLADGVFYLSKGRLKQAGACEFGACEALRGMEPKLRKNLILPSDREVMIDRRTVRNFLRAEPRRLSWISQKLVHRRELSYDQHRMLHEILYCKWDIVYGGRDRTELVFAMLELVARKRGLIA